MTVGEYISWYKLRGGFMEYIKDQLRIDSLLPELYKFKAWGVDSETSGLDPHTSKVTLLQFGRPEKQYIIDTRKVNIEPIRQFLEDPSIMKIGHNMKFDYKMFRGSFGIEMEYIRDTFVGEKVLTAGKKYRGFGLDDVLKERLGVDVDKTLQKSFINHTGDFSAEQLEYASNDVKHLLPLCQTMIKDIVRDDLGRTFQLECDAIPAFGDMEFDGMILDTKAWREVLVRNIEKSVKVKAELDNIVEPYVGLNLFNEVEINYGSPPQMVKLLNQMKLTIMEYDRETKKEHRVPIKATDKKTLQKLRDVPFIKLLQGYRSLLVRINTFGEPYIKAVHPKTGRIHPDFWQIGTETGRPAAGESDVNPLNIPKENEYRHCFIADANEIVESDDYSGCESRILAEISGDTKLIEIFRQGLDIHCSVASELYRVPVTKDNENKKLRTPAKSLNFG